MASRWDQPNICSAWMFQSVMIPAASISMKASSAVSTTHRARASLLRNDTSTSLACIFSCCASRCSLRTRFAVHTKSPNVGTNMAPLARASFQMAVWIGASTSRRSMRISTVQRIPSNPPRDRVLA